MSASKIKLPLLFDVAAMHADIERFRPDEWVPHFNQHYYQGDWSGVALRSVEGGRDSLFPDPAATSYVDTQALSRCEYVPEVIKTFECGLESVRFLRLGPGASIRRHRDFKLSIDDGVARVHIPVKTNENVRFYLEDELVPMMPGEAWYLNFNLHHSVENTSTETRVHLVADCIVNDWFREIFAEAQVQ
jgi:hypothetical protein